MIVSVCLVGGSWFIPIMYYTRGVLGLIRKEAPDDESEHLCLPCYSNEGKQDGDDGLLHFAQSKVPSGAWPSASTERVVWRELL